MEPIAPPAFNPHLKQVLKSYQSAAVKSLSGPSNYVAGWGDSSKLSPAELKAMLSLTGGLKREGLETPKFEISISQAAHSVGQQMPLFLPMDSSRSEKTETVLEGETIACFVVGGEKRLCLPQILNTVLRDFTLQEINNICDELHIFCSRCNSEQLEILKVTEVLPMIAPSCGLITKTDAERLCNALLHRSPEKAAEPPSPNAFKVYHECFGKCKGLFSPELYSSPYAKCIECFDCRGMFSPQKFVVHSHKGLENRTCHWGFDSANWRSYLLLAKDQDNRTRCQRILDDIKARFDFTSRYKRKENHDDEKDETKRVRYDEGSTPSKVLEWSDGQVGATSAFRPWSPGGLSQAVKEGKLSGLAAPPGYREGMSRSLPSYLKTGPPVLLNPERVITASESKRYERHFAPNVSLAPASQQKGVKDEDADENDVIDASMKPSRSTSLPDLDVRIASTADGRPTVATTRREEEVLDIDTSSSDFESSVRSSSDFSVPSTPGADAASAAAAAGLTSPRPTGSPPRADLSPRHADGSSPSRPEAEAGDGEVDNKGSAAVEMLRRALDGGVNNTNGERESFIAAFMRLQVSQEERIQSLEQDNRELRQRMDREHQEKKSIRRELEQLKVERDKQLEEKTRQMDLLQSQLKAARALQHPDLSKIKAQLEKLEASITDKGLSKELKGEFETQRVLLEKLNNNVAIYDGPVSPPSAASADANQQQDFRGSRTDGDSSDTEDATEFAAQTRLKPGSEAAKASESNS